MRCAWNEVLNLQPQWLRPIVDKLADSTLQEIRLRIGKKPEFITSNGSNWYDRIIEEGDISYCINAASQYSPWAATTITQGYITARGGHRIGICGNVTLRDGKITGMNTVNQLCIRVARDFVGIAEKARRIESSVLIIGPPGSGKSTLLRDMIRQISDHSTGSVAVVDERGELFPFINGRACFDTGRRTDILTGCSKAQGIDILLRTMGPSVIAVDEITAVDDCVALVQAGWCGVRILATAHAANSKDLYTRPVYRELTESGLFDDLIVLKKDKTWTLERMKICT